MNSRIALAFTAATAGLTLLAQGADSAGEVKTAGFRLQNRSAFTSPETARAPFWPIGWAKASATAPQTQAPLTKIELDPEQFAVTSIVLGQPSLAVINGRVYSQGEFLRMPKGGKAPEAAAKTAALPAGARIRVAKVTDGSVFLEVGGQYTELALRRPQLSQHKPDEAEEDLLKPLSER